MVEGGFSKAPPKEFSEGPPKEFTEGLPNGL
jgi:hypothetical protein